MTVSTKRPKVLIFDVNETLLDLSLLKARIDDLLLKPQASTLWFTTLLQYSLVMTVSDQYAPFQDIGASTLQMLARNSDIVLELEDAKGALSVMKTLPPHGDVLPALEQLKSMGFRLAALTNSSQAGIEAQLEYAGLSKLFERALSVETVRKFKPHKAVYQWAVNELGGGCERLHDGGGAWLGCCRRSMGGIAHGVYSAAWATDVSSGWSS